jgi:hypothetical protein
MLGWKFDIGWINEGWTQTKKCRKQTKNKIKMMVEQYLRRRFINSVS